MAKDLEKIINILACPNCQSSLTLDNKNLYCQQCKQSYKIIENRPILLPAEIMAKIKNIKSKIISSPKSKIKNFGDKLMIKWLDKNTFNFINNLPEKTKILNLGSGTGMFDNLIKKEMVNLDIELYQNHTDIIGDAHKLPLKTASFDCVFSQAVLEHVARPWKVADEIHRVLKPEGYVVISVPFLGALHGKTDYYRFTNQGLEEIFNKFKKINSGVNAGPATFLSIFMSHFFSLLMPIKVLRKPTLYFFATILWPIKFIDILIAKNKNLKILASSIYFIGQKKLIKQ